MENDTHSVVVAIEMTIGSVTVGAVMAVVTVTVGVTVAMSKAMSVAIASIEPAIPVVVILVGNIVVVLVIIRATDRYGFTRRIVNNLLMVRHGRCHSNDACADENEGKLHG